MFRYGTLAYCLWLPEAMDGLLAVASLLIFDVFEEAKLPCFIAGYTYFDKIKIAVFAPLAFVGVIGLACILWAARPKKRQRMKLGALKRKTKRGSDHYVKDGLWAAAPICLFLLDLLWPSITRTLFQFFSCRPLGASGRWLEVDYGPPRFCRRLLFSGRMRCIAQLWP